MAEDDNNTAAATTGSTPFTAAETTFLVTMLQHLTGEIQFDAEKVAQTLGFKDATVARARWNTIKRKKIAGAVASAASPAGVKKGGKGSTPKKGKTAAPTEDGGEEAVESPAKTTPKRGRPKKGKKEVEGADSAAKDDDAGEVAVKGEEEEDSFT